MYENKASHVVLSVSMSQSVGVVRKTVIHAHLRAVSCNGNRLRFIQRKPLKTARNDRANLLFPYYI